jgi:hypothetical protein
MPLVVASLSVELVASLRPLVLRIKRYDRSLADQLVRAASSVALNIAEAEYSDPGTCRAVSRPRAARMSRSRRCVAVRKVPPGEAEVAEALLRRVLAMLWRLTR